MTKGYTSTTPPIASAPGQKEWHDVAKWQAFLVAHHELQLSDATHETNVFGQKTQDATKKFQREHPALPETGCVNYATYKKAVREGLAGTKPVIGEPCAQFLHLKNHMGATGRYKLVGNVEIQSVGSGQHIPTQMKPGCLDSASVKLWQQELCCLGYMSTATGNYDPTTQLETKAFQSDSGLALTGNFDLNTYKKANAICTFDVVLDKPPCP